MRAFAFFGIAAARAAGQKAKKSKVRMDAARSATAPFHHHCVVRCVSIAANNSSDMVMIAKNASSLSSADASLTVMRMACAMPIATRA